MMTIRDLGRKANGSTAPVAYGLNDGGPGDAGVKEGLLSNDPRPMARFSSREPIEIPTEFQPFPTRTNRFSNSARRQTLPPCDIMRTVAEVGPDPEPSCPALLGMALPSSLSGNLRQPDHGELYRVCTTADVIIRRGQGRSSSIWCGLGRRTALRCYSSRGSSFGNRRG